MSAVTRYFVDANGVYLGAFVGATPPQGAIEVPEAPADARQIWSGSAWGAAPSTPRRFSKRQLFGAMSDAQYATFMQVQAQQPPRLQAVFAAATELNESDPDFPQLVALMGAYYGEAETARLLDAAAVP